MSLLGTKLGKRVIMVVEKLEELKQIITISKQLGVEPLVGIRARLLSKGAGRWAESGGENAKFGLSTGEILAATDNDLLGAGREVAFGLLDIREQPRRFDHHIHAQLLPRQLRRIFGADHQHLLAVDDEHIVLRLVRRGSRAV